MYNFLILIFIFGANAKADTSTGIFIACDQLNGLHYLIGCCKYSNEQKAYISNKKNWLINLFSGERKYSRWQRKHIRGWHPPGVREHKLSLYVKKEDAPWFNFNVKLKIKVITPTGKKSISTAFHSCQYRQEKLMLQRKYRAIKPTRIPL